MRMNEWKELCEEITQQNLFGDEFRGMRCRLKKPGKMMRTAVITEIENIGDELLLRGYYGNRGGKQDLLSIPARDHSISVQQTATGGKIIHWENAVGKGIMMTFPRPILEP